VLLAETAGVGPVGLCQLDCILPVHKIKRFKPIVLNLSNGCIFLGGSIKFVFYSIELYWLAAQL
jgi:hypothetical protein